MAAPLSPAFGPMPIFVATALSFVGWLLLVAYLIFADTEWPRPGARLAAVVHTTFAEELGQF